MEELVPVHILLMSNSAQCGKLIEYCFDLKGSEINRETPEEEITKKGQTLKDGNLLKICKDEYILVWQLEDRMKIAKRVKLDTEFLEKHNIMDHSLLLIVETNPAWR
jgi:hypothetical protein